MGGFYHAKNRRPRFSRRNAVTDPFRTPQQTPWGWSWSVPGAAGIEATREAAEAQINRYRNVRTKQ